MFSARSCPDWHYKAALGHAPATTATWTSDHSKATVKCTRSGCSQTWSGNSTKKVTTSATCSVAEKYQHTATFSVNGTSKTFTCGTTHTGSTHSHTWSYTCDTTCNCCGCTRSASHNMQQTKAPTCTATGTKTCSYGCGTTSTIDKLGHKWTTTKSATCGASGSRKCSRCSTTETIAATGNHTKPSGQAQYPTCTENVCCTVCGKEIYAKLECGGVTGKYSLLYNYYTQEWYQWIIGQCTKYEACCQATRTGTCDKVYSSSNVSHSSQGSHSHR